MQDAENVYRVSFDPVHGEVWQPGENELARAGLAASSSLFWKSCQGCDLFMDGKCDAAGRDAAGMLFKVIDDSNEVVGCGFRPADSH